MYFLLSDAKNCNLDHCLVQIEMDALFFCIQNGLCIFFETFLFIFFYICNSVLHSLTEVIEFLKTCLYDFESISVFNFDISILLI